MHRAHDSLVLAPTDLSAFLGCRHRTGLDLAAAFGLLEKPVWTSAALQALQQRGAEHERRYVESLRASGLRVVEVETVTGATRDDGRPDVAVRVAATLEAMRAGADVIVQAALEHVDPGSGLRWRGFADILRRVETPSALGEWSYEAHDTKLARETRGGTILQLTAYSDMLARIQQMVPERFHVVTPHPKASSHAWPFAEHTFRFAEYAAYYRLVMKQIGGELARAQSGVPRAAEAPAVEGSIEAAIEALCTRYYPEPVEQCDVCRWWDHCNARRRADDHLSFIANCGRVQRTELQSQGIATLAAAAAMSLPLPFRPSRGSAETYERIRDQARMQVRQRLSGKPEHELLLPVEPGFGLARLPAPSPGDLFLDLEAARFACEGGREYLFGLWSSDGVYRAWWAHDAVEERAAFDQVMHVIVGALDSDPNMHVYHFGHYEPSAFKRLMGRHALAADDLDRLLRGERFVNLLTVVRQALLAGVESYSIKQLEPLYEFTRDIDLREASANLQAIELALEAGTAEVIPEEVRAAVQGYNRDDCRSTQALCDWLERLRAELEAEGTSVPRPGTSDDAPSEQVRELDARAEALRARLLDGLPPGASEPEHPRHARWLMAYLVDWHRREDKAQWWDYFRVRELDDDELLDEPKALVGLEFVERVEVVTHRRTGKPTGSVVDRYRYPSQECDVRRNDVVELRSGERFGSVDTIDRQARLVDIKKGPSAAGTHASVLFDKSVVPSKVVQCAVMAVADALLSASGHETASTHATAPADETSAGDETARGDETGPGDETAPGTCGLQLLWRRPPRLAGGVAFEQARRDTETALSVVEFAERVVLQLDRGTLAIQGPPGSGKTYAGARMIRTLVREGRRVGVTAVSHKVICNLLEEVEKQSQAAGEIVRLGRKSNDEGGQEGPIREFASNEDALDALTRGEVHVLGGTAWLWSRDDAVGAADVLFVDEAGQMSLANALAVSRAATSLVLLGDPQQLDQPQKALHPPGADVSALEHVLGGEKTMPLDRGLFLPTTWRLAPAICRFTSEVFYEGRLQSRDGLERQRLAGTGSFDGAGLWWVPVEHDGNQNWSVEEVDVVERIVQQLLAPGARWVNDRDEARALTPGDLRVVAPYNAQVNRLTDRLAGLGVPVGTVDKFQGQEAPVVVYSMATSRPEDAPRGMEFLYSLNRLNVATSRARCAAIVVASPRLVEPECRTPRQMQLANALCRFVELTGS